MKRRQLSGTSLVVALVMLVMMSAGAISLVRAISAGRMMAANLAFRQGAVLASDAGSEAAIAWLSKEVSSANVYVDQAANGYYASVPDGLDITGQGPAGSTVSIDWDDDRCKAAASTVCVKAAPALAADSAGNVIRYTIHRLCRASGSPQVGTNSCLMAGGDAAASSKRGNVSYGSSSRFNVSMGVYYRITVRVRGPRNTVVFTQTLVHF